MSTTPVKNLPLARASTTPVLMRAIHGKVEPEVEHVINLLSNGLKDAHDAITSLKQQHETLKGRVNAAGIK